MRKIYIVKCSDDTLYTGITTDIGRRIDEHNGKGLWAKYTKMRQPVELVYTFDMKNRSEASKQESKIKKLTKKQKLELIGNANKTRCSWLNNKNLEYIKYHDEEWWVPIHDDTKLFEMLVLEWAQAWLSWETILKKRENYKKAFNDYNLEKIVKYSEKKIEKLRKNPGIVRNKLKIKSVIKNAEVFLDIKEEFWSFDKYIWSYVDFKPVKNTFYNYLDMPTKTNLSDKISKDLKKRWMSFVWTTIIYAYMQAIWMVRDHEKWCFKC